MVVLELPLLPVMVRLAPPVLTEVPGMVVCDWAAEGADPELPGGT